MWLVRGPHPKNTTVEVTLPQPGAQHMWHHGEVMFTSRKGPIRTLERTKSYPVVGTDLTTATPGWPCSHSGRTVRPGARWGQGGGPPASKGRQISSSWARESWASWVSLCVPMKGPWKTGLKEAFVICARGDHIQL